MTRLSIGTIFFTAVILLVTTHVNAGLDEELVFYLDFDNVKKQAIVDTSKVATTWASIKTMSVYP